MDNLLWDTTAIIILYFNEKLCEILFTLASLSADNGTHQRKKQIGRLNSGSREAPSRPHACPLDSGGRARSRMPQPTAPDLEGARRTRHSIPATTAALQALGLHAPLPSHADGSPAQAHLTASSPGKGMEESASGEKLGHG